jgi:hypothetical protein
MSRAAFLQDAAAYLAHEDSDAAAELRQIASQAQSRNLRQAQSGSVGTAKQLRSSDKAAAEMAKSAEAAKAEAAKAEAEAAHAVAAAKAEAANSARLKTELTQAVRNQYSLRRRLKEVSTEARTRLAQLLKQLEVAKAAAERSEGLLRDEIKKETSKLKTAEESENQLRQDLASAQAASASAGKSAANAAAEATAQNKANLESMSKMKADMAKMKKDASMQTSKLQEQLRQKQQADAAAQSKFAAQLKQAQEASTKERSALEAKIQDSQRASEKVSDELEAEQLSEKLLRANLTRTSQNAELAAAKAKKERMGLLVQVSELQDQSSGAQKKALAAEQEAKHAKEDAKMKIDQQVASTHKQELQRQHRISVLLQETQAAHSNLTQAATAATAARQQVSALQAAVAEKEEQLRVALLESNDLKAARDVATKGEATFQKMDATAEASLKEDRKELSSAKSELQQVKSDLSSREGEATRLAAKCQTLEAQLASLKKSSAAEEAATQEKTHDYMINAAQKVHELEDQNENVSSMLQDMKQQLATATAESSKAKDTLMQETTAALQASQKSDSLQKVLDQAQKEADSSSKRAEELKKQVDELKTEQDQAKVSIAERKDRLEAAESKAESLEAAETEETSETKKAKAENKQLKTQIKGLTGEEQRADELEEELGGLRQQMQQKDSAEASMAKKLELLRSLKDHYSSDAESSKQESEEWHQKVQNLKELLKKTKHSLKAVAQQRDKALERAKEARSQEDEYFEENSDLQTQDKEFQQKIVDMGAAANHSNDETEVLQQQVDELKAEAEREKANSHAAFVTNQNELMEARQDLQMSLGVNRNLQAELQRMQAVLSDKERQTLGLPPLKKDASVKAVAPTASPVVAAASEEKQVVLEEKHEDEHPPSPLTPQVAERKHWETAEEAARSTAKKLLAKKAVAAPVEKASAVSIVKALPAQKKVAKLSTTQTPLPGEPPKPSNDAEATLASVTNSKPAAGHSKKSALQKLADFFASPLPR